jgi:hypothetical protein
MWKSANDISAMIKEDRRWPVIQRQRQRKN